MLFRGTPLWSSLLSIVDKGKCYVVDHETLTDNDLIALGIVSSFQVLSHLEFS